MRAGQDSKGVSREASCHGLAGWTTGYGATFDSGWCLLNPDER
jgi:hypothetical protein